MDTHTYILMLLYTLYAPTPPSPKKMLLAFSCWCHGWDSTGFKPDSRIDISFRSNKNGFEMHFECDFSSFMIHSLTWSHLCNEESYCLANVFLHSQSIGLLQLFTQWHHFWSNVPPSKNSKSCSQLFFAKANMSMLHHFSKSFTGS